MSRERFLALQLVGFGLGEFFWLVVVFLQDGEGGGGEV